MCRAACRWLVSFGGAVLFGCAVAAGAEDDAWVAAMNTVHQEFKGQL